MPPILATIVANEDIGQGNVHPKMVTKEAGAEMDQVVKLVVEEMVTEVVQVASQHRPGSEMHQNRIRLGAKLSRAKPSTSTNQLLLSLHQNLSLPSSIGSPGFQIQRFWRPARHEHNGFLLLR
jgi:hypothetical protein